ncbi:conserved hypothetical protein [Candidatus Methylobacter favarea]|uniref:Uncharacterized protein n=1 Tax=Candidatus Methylobacter favarea TaxID=2707345 RepID=A0A8S0XFD8_9GAMM|nr:hypothetical protein [Candidatus Methylobacter favarea]CAA9890374.1 conserved hypothetical protein [Candidatus Methylobacter favarea]
MAKRKQQNLIKGTAHHRRTEDDYMGVLLDTVTLDDWQAVVAGALKLAKEGDLGARAWLAQYLVGKPAGKAPTPLTVVVQQLNNADPVVEKLAHKTVWNMEFPEDDWKENIKATIAAELTEKLQ